MTREKPESGHGRTAETVVPLPGPRKAIPAATAYRSTWIVSGLETLRHSGHLERYRSVLRAHHEEIFSCVAGVWLPMPMVRAHYEACEALKLSEQEIVTMIRSAPGGHVRRAWHSNLISAAQRARSDTSNWAVLTMVTRAWERSANGGACALYRLAECRALVEYVGCELFDIPYYRASTRVVLMVLVERFGGKVSLEAKEADARGEASYLVEWG